MKEWNGVGHVPFKEKDRIYKQYHSQIDKLFERFNISASNKKLSNFKSTISSIQEGSPQAFTGNVRSWYVPRQYEERAPDI